MSQVATPIRPFPAGPLGSTGGVSPQARRGRSAGRRSGDSRETLLTATAVAAEARTREAAEAVLLQRDRMIAVFGHDLRGLLNALTVNAELFLRREGESALESARSVRLAVGRMDQLISSLLDYVQVKADRLHVEPRPLDAAGLLREAVEIFRPLARVKSLSLILAIAETPLWAIADHDRMFQVLSNLLSNAIKFSSVKGEITVHATTAGQDLHVTVRDEGLGIPEGDLERVFDCFCQLKEQDARGLGLGLYISRSIILAHGGKIWATSRPGEGSTFSFTIPLSPASDVVEAPGPTA